MTTACLTSVPNIPLHLISVSEERMPISPEANSCPRLFLAPNLFHLFFTEIIVLSELVTACLLAVTPTSLSPSFEKATTLGVVLEPSEFGITTAFPPSIVATQLFVVPKSIPITADPISISPDFFSNYFSSNVMSSMPLLISHWKSPEEACEVRNS